MILTGHFGFLWRFPLTTPSQTSVPRSPFPAPRSPFHVLVTSFLSRISNFYLASNMSKFLFRTSHFYLTFCIFHLTSRIIISHLAFFYLASCIFYLACRIFYLASRIFYLTSRILYSSYRSSFLSASRIFYLATRIFYLELSLDFLKPSKLSCISHVSCRLPWVCENKIPQSMHTNLISPSTKITPELDTPISIKVASVNHVS